MPCRFRRWRGPSPACGESRTRHIPAQAERCTPAQATTIGSPAMPPLTSQIYSSTPTTRSTPSPPRSSHHPLGARTPTALVPDLLLPHSVLQKIANRSGQDCGKNSTKTIDGGRFHTQVPSAPPSSLLLHPPSPLHSHPNYLLGEPLSCCRYGQMRMHSRGEEDRSLVFEGILVQK